MSLTTRVELRPTRIWVWSANRMARLPMLLVRRASPLTRLCLSSTPRQLSSRTKRSSSPPLAATTEPAAGGATRDGDSAIGQRRKKRKDAGRRETARGQLTRHGEVASSEARYSKVTENLSFAATKIKAISQALECSAHCSALPVFASARKPWAFAGRSALSAQAAGLSGGRASSRPISSFCFRSCWANGFCRTGRSR